MVRLGNSPEPRSGPRAGCVQKQYLCISSILSHAHYAFNNGVDKTSDPSNTTAPSRVVSQARAPDCSEAYTGTT